MKKIMWALVLMGLLLVGSAVPAEVAAGGPGGRGGGARAAGGGFHGGGVRWAGGGWRGGAPGWHGGWHGGTRVVIRGSGGWWGGPVWWGGPGWWGGAPLVVVQPPPTEFIQQAPTPPQQSYWYYCQNAGAYFPYVRECPGGWMQVVPSPNPPDR